MNEYTLFEMDGTVTVVRARDAEEAINSSGGRGLMMHLDFWAEGDERANWEFREGKWHHV